MERIAKVLGLIFVALLLSSCSTNEDSENMNYGSYQTSPYANYASSYQSNYQQNYYADYQENYQQNYQQSGVVVPESYHVGQYHSPQSFKNRDQEWVSGQNPQGYTIELADDEKAAAVAQKLYKAPKNDRRAQVKYYRNGKVYYKGVYGTYENADEAQKAMESLPPEIRQKAGVKNWGSVQNNLDE